MTDSDYAGDLSPKKTWELLSSDPKARLVDVRTMPEWAFVGVPDLKSLDKQLYFISWQLFPNMQQNPEFADQVRSSGVETGDPLFFICRSGGRSRMAAIAMTGQGYTRCYNVAFGFEGDHDAGGRHRGKESGWKVDGLPWVQE